MNSNTKIFQNILNKHANDVNNFINQEINNQAIKQLYVESNPRTLSEYFYYIRAFQNPFDHSIIINLQNTFNIKRTLARGIYKICSNWINFGYTPSGKASYK